MTSMLSCFICCDWLTKQYYTILQVFILKNGMKFDSGLFWDGASKMSNIDRDDQTLTCTVKPHMWNLN
jgi:hypothetical protein